MNERRTPRAHLQSEAIGEDIDSDAPAVTPLLVEHLEQQFPVRLSHIPNTADIIQQDQARLTGQQEVLDYLRKLSQTANR